MLKTGRVLICPGGHHLYLKMVGKKILIHTELRRESDKYVPSVDALMTSAADIFKSKVLGVLLTGMGNDGKARHEKNRQGEGRHHHCRVGGDCRDLYGMPKEAILAGAVDKILPLLAIADEMIHQCLAS